MLFFPPEDIHDVYISIIDTQALKAYNDIFFVPDLAFLTKSGSLKTMHHEYLAHGTIRGNAHRAVPLSVFHKAGFERSKLHTPGEKIKNHHPQKVTPSEVRRARSVAEDYGYHLAAPVALALLCLEERNVDLFLREGDVDLKTVLDWLAGLHIPRNWSEDTSVMEDVTYIGNYLDVRQFIHLMRAIVRHQVRNVHVHDRTSDKVSSDDGKHGFEKQSGYKWFIRFANGKAKIVKRIQRDVRQKPLNRTVARVVKSGDSRRILKIDTAALERAIKKLDVNMSGYGSKDNGNKGEKKSREQEY